MTAAKLIPFFPLFLFCSVLIAQEHKEEFEVGLPQGGAAETMQVVIHLPEARLLSKTPLEKAIAERRSVRDYEDEALELADLTQLFWAAQGISDRKGLRTVPSAGVVYPLAIYAAVGNVNGLTAGIYKYLPRENSLLKIADGDRRKVLAAAAFGQEWMGKCSVIFGIAADYGKMEALYGKRGVRYVDMEAGHAGQNISLQAVSLDVAACLVGAFQDEEVKRMFGLSVGEQPLYLIPAGRKAGPPGDR